MIVRYSFELVARCPHDRLPDRYAVTVEAERVIRAEDIQAFAQRYSDPKAKKHLAQEEITVELARHFAAKVTTLGEHYGVRTECVA